jgi:Fe-S cluster assembly ATP-binding protein
MLTIQKLTVRIQDKQVLQEISLSIKKGEIHLIMGPNGAGKSSLAKVLAGDPTFHVEKGAITYDQKNLLTLSPEQRSLQGLFVGFQHPEEIAGINNGYFLYKAFQLRTSKHFTQKEFQQLFEKTSQDLGIPTSFYHHSLNANLSGGEKKLNELLQMVLFNPKCAILDEIDAGLDADKMQCITKAIKQDPHRTWVFISHNQRLFHLIHPHVIHIFHKGKILASGGKELITRIEKEGYRWLDGNS